MYFDRVSNDLVWYYIHLLYVGFVYDAKGNSCNMEKYMVINGSTPVEIYRSYAQFKKY